MPLPTSGFWPLILMHSHPQLAVSANMSKWSVELVSYGMSYMICKQYLKLNHFVIKTELSEKCTYRFSHYLYVCCLCKFKTQNICWEH